MALRKHRVSWWARVRSWVVNGILGLSDTPHRIALGVFLGLFIAWTPTLGFQIMLYVPTAALFRANRVSGIPLLFISNPFTAVPVYYAAWWLGAWVLRTTTGVFGEGEAVNHAVDERLRMMTRLGDYSFFSSEFWQALGETLLSLGAELWLGSVVLGVFTGLIGYVITRWAVGAYRASRS